MNLTSAHARLRELGVATFTTNDAAAALRIDGNHASQVLQRLARTRHVVRLARGRWALPERVQPFMLPEALTAPKPSYVSLYSALYHHGLIEQIPDVVYAITLAPTRRVDTPFGTVSLHQAVPEFFFGYEVEPKTGVKIASPEKALLDVLYLRQARSHAFRALPELELPATFDRKRARAIARRISSAPRRKFVMQELDRTLSHTR
jgi:predicted transcriptional regulator of viral defense system